MELERRRIMLVSMIGGFLGAALAAALFGAGVLFERRRRPGKREAGRMEPPDPQAELRRRQWEDWMGFLHYDGTPPKDGHETR